MPLVSCAKKVFLLKLLYFAWFSYSLLCHLLSWLKKKGGIFLWKQCKDMIAYPTILCFPWSWASGPEILSLIFPHSSRTQPRATAIPYILTQGGWGLVRIIWKSPHDSQIGTFWISKTHWSSSPASPTLSLCVGAWIAHWETNYLMWLMNWPWCFCGRKVSFLGSPYMYLGKNYL